uniref:External NADH-ubiquinone oxidoreductase 1, mitochondrial-like n=1 Tax=Dermatophagoides pteronyssinus TaxID=6956 RepID=A0A6P6YC17_DERPT|nr:external NADH-ubiquinone oxidoreductase 1, mitochondrial-like [Dermatophagoides pteronyssinus]
MELKTDLKIDESTGLIKDNCDLEDGEISTYKTGSTTLKYNSENFDFYTSMVVLKTGQATSEDYGTLINPSQNTSENKGERGFKRIISQLRSLRSNNNNQAEPVEENLDDNKLERKQENVFALLEMNSDKSDNEESVSQAFTSPREESNRSNMNDFTDIPYLKLAFSKLVDPNKRYSKLWTNILNKLKKNSNELDSKKENVTVLGSGWASTTFIKNLDPKLYHVTLISPRPWFTMTPLLTAAISGRIGLRTVISPVSRYLFKYPKRGFELIKGEAIDYLGNNTIKIKTNCNEEKIHKYDKLVIGVGSVTNTFNIPGVEKKVSFLKTIDDVREIREKLFNNFAIAKNNNLSPKEKEKLLSIAIVGGGFAGVETAFELQNLIETDLKFMYPDEAKFAKISIVEMLPNMLPICEKSVSEFANNTLDQQKIKRYNNCRVTLVDADAINVVDKNSTSFKIPASQVIWVSGIMQTSFVKKLIDKIEQQKDNRFLLVNPDLSVIGTKDMYAFGDCSRLTVKPLSSIIYKECVRNVSLQKQLCSTTQKLFEGRFN